MIHHIAIGTKDPENLSNFYLSLPGIQLIRKFYYEDSSLRSVWLQSINSEMIIMIEKSEILQAPKALVFSIKNLDVSPIIPLVVQRTDYTIYIHDYDGNLVGYSCYPEPIQNYIHNF